MKKLIALVLMLFFVLSMVGCNTKPIKANVLKAWSGEFSEGKLKSTIKKYKSDYENIVIENSEQQNVSFETDFEAKGVLVTRLSLVDDNDIEVELNSYLDLYIQAKCDGTTVTIPIDWWYSSDGWADDYIWSYLVRVKDANGTYHVYYFRVDYSACTSK